MLSKTSRYELRAVLLLTLTFGIVFFDRNAINYLMPAISQELKLSQFQIGVAVSALSVTWAASGCLFGWISDRTRSRKAILIAAVCAFSLCSFITGLVGSFFALLGARLLMGVAEGPVLPLAQSIAAAELQPAHRGLGMGVVNNFGSNLLGSFVAPFVLVALMTSVGWRNAFYVAGIPGLVMAAILWIFIREPGDSHVHDELQLSSRSIGGTLTHRNMILCMLISFFSVGFILITWTFLPLHLVNVAHYSASRMGAMLSVLGLSATLTSMCVPGLADRIGRKPAMIIFSFTALLLPIGVYYFVNNTLLLGLLLFIGWSIQGTVPLFFAVVPSETVSPRKVATALGLTMAVGEVAGGFIGLPLAGWGADTWGPNAPLILQGLFALLAGCCACFLIETAPGLSPAVTPRLVGSNA